jgi:hypothetical protein
MGYYTAVGPVLEQVFRSWVNRVPPSRELSAQWPILLLPSMRIPPLKYRRLGNDMYVDTDLKVVKKSNDEALQASRLVKVMCLVLTLINRA